MGFSPWINGENHEKTFLMFHAHVHSYTHIQNTHPALAILTSIFGMEAEPLWNILFIQSFFEYIIFLQILPLQIH